MLLLLALTDVARQRLGFLLRLCRCFLVLWDTVRVEYRARYFQVALIEHFFCFQTAHDDTHHDLLPVVCFVGVVGDDGLAAVGVQKGVHKVLAPLRRKPLLVCAELVEPFLPEKQFQVCPCDDEAGVGIVSRLRRGLLSDGCVVEVGLFLAEDDERQHVDVVSQRKEPLGRLRRLAEAEHHLGELPPRCVVVSQRVPPLGYQQLRELVDLLLALLLKLPDEQVALREQLLQVEDADDRLGVLVQHLPHEPSLGVPPQAAEQLRGSGRGLCGEHLPQLLGEPRDEPADVKQTVGVHLQALITALAAQGGTAAKNPCIHRAVSRVLFPCPCISDRASPSGSPS